MLRALHHRLTSTFNNFMFTFYVFLMVVSVCTINVNGIAEHPKCKRIFKYLLDQRFDIYLLQETHLSDVMQGKLWEKQWGGRALWSPGTNRSAGVGFLLLHPGSAIEVTGHNINTDGRVIAANLKHNNQSFQILNVYAPHNYSKRETFFDNLWRFMFRNVDTIMAGDFNCVPDVLLDKWEGDDTFGDKGITQLNTFADSLSLEDVFRVKHPTDRVYTWFNGPHLVGCRLDRFYTPQVWRPHVRNLNCQPCSHSDHHLVSITLQLGHSHPRERGVWKFNTRLLKSDTFCTDMNNFWPQWQLEKPIFTDPRVWWDVGKLQLNLPLPTASRPGTLESVSAPLSKRNFATFNHARVRTMQITVPVCLRSKISYR